MTDAQQRENARLMDLLTKANVERDHDAYRAMVRQALDYLLRGDEERRAQLEELHDMLEARTLTPEQLASLTEDISNKNFNAEIGRRLKKWLSRLATGLALIAAAAAAWHAVEFIAAKLGLRK